MSTNYGSLGKQIVISPKTLVKVENGTVTMELSVNGHPIDIEMSENAWVALKNGKPVFANTLKNFKEQTINHRKK